MQRNEGPELRCRRHLARDVARLQPVDLVDGDHDGDAEAEHALADEPVPGADPRPAVDHEQHGVDLVEGPVDGALHALGEGVARSLKAWHVDEHELVALAVRDAEDPATGRLGLVRDDDDLRAAERVDERGLPDVGPAGDGDEAALHGSFGPVLRGFPLGAPHLPVP